MAILLAGAVVVNARGGWLPVGDHALTRMWTDAVVGSHPPLVGGDARFGWDHLGPWLFYLFAVPSWILGRSAVGLLIGAGAINIVSLVAVARCVRAVVNDRVAAVVTTGALVFVIGAAGPRLVDPWNPYVVQLPFLLTIVASWAVVAGHGRWLAWAIGAGTLAAQGHITFLPPVVVLLVLAIGSVVTARTRLTAGQRRAAVAVAVAGWLPPVIDLVLPGRHNMADVARFFLGSSPSSPPAGLAAGMRVVLRETGVRGSWLGGRPPLGLFTNAFDGSLGVLPGLGVGALAVAAWVVRRRHHGDQPGGEPRREVGIKTSGDALWLLIGVVVALLGVGVVEMAMARGPLYPYLFGWVGLVGMMSWAVPVAVLVDRARWSSADALAVVVAVVAAVVLAATMVNAERPRSPLERPDDAAIVKDLVTRSLPQLDRHQRYRLDHGHDGFNSIYELGVASELRRRGMRLVVPPRLAVLFGRFMVASPTRALPVITVVSPFEGPTPGDHVLAAIDPLTPTERAEEVQLTATLVAAFQQAGDSKTAGLITVDEGRLLTLAEFNGPGPTLGPQLERLAALRRRGRAVAVIERNP